MHKQLKRKKWASVYANALQLILFGMLTGVFSGAVTTLFTLLAEKGEELSHNAYAFVRENPAFLPLLVLALALGGFLISVAVRVSSVIRGCGIPQAEGATRGSIRFRWWRDAVAMFAACLVSIFMGLSIGAEGPSAFIGACMGDGVGACTHRNEMIKRYQITGGACTGLAVASNAPLTGIIFAFEEAHKRFTPEVFICAFSSVIFGMLTKMAIFEMLHLPLGASFHSFVFHEMPITAYGFVCLAGLASGLLGVAFYKWTFLVRGWFAKISGKHRIGIRIAIAVAIGGIFSFLASDVMGGGHALIEKLGSHGGMQQSNIANDLGTRFVWALIVIILLKLLITSVNVGSGIPCGIFIPILAIGACLGGLLSRGFIAWGMDEKYADMLVMICMAGLFSSIVKAPLTAIVMVCEFTGSFAPLLPVVIAVSIGYFIGDMFRTDGIYEELLEVYEHETGILGKAVKEVYQYTVATGAIAEKREVRDVLWPFGARVTEIWRGEEHIIPDGDTVLHSGDTLTIVCKTAEHEKVKNELNHILG